MLINTLGQKLPKPLTQLHIRFRCHSEQLPSLLLVAQAGSRRLPTRSGLCFQSAMSPGPRHLSALHFLLYNKAENRTFFYLSASYIQPLTKVTQPCSFKKSKSLCAHDLAVHWWLFSLFKMKEKVVERLVLELVQVLELPATISNQQKHPSCVPCSQLRGAACTHCCSGWVLLHCLLFSGCLKEVGSGVALARIGWRLRARLKGEKKKKVTQEMTS